MLLKLTSEVGLDGYRIPHFHGPDGICKDRARGGFRNCWKEGGGGANFYLNKIPDNLAFECICIKCHSLN